MKILNFFKQKQKEDKNNMILSLDVGTSFVKACVFIKKRDSIYLLGYGRARQQSEAMNGAMIVNLEKVIDAADIAIGEAVKDLRDELPRKVIIGIAGELVRGVTIVASYDREKPEEKISNEEVEKVLAQVKKNAFQNVKNEISEDTGLIAENIEEINSRVTDTHVDGFKVNNVIGFKGKEVDFKIFSTFAPSIHVNSLKSIAEALGLEILSIIVEPYALTRGYKGAGDEKFSGIFIDVGGGTTDVAVVENGSISGTKMFAFGGNLFTKRLEKNFNLSFAEAEELKIAYSENELSEKKSQEIAKIFEKDARIWANGVEIALREFDEVKIYPSKILLCGGGALLPEIKKSLIEHPWLQSLKFRKFPDIDFISPKNLNRIIDEGNYLTDISDVTPACLAVAGIF